MEFQNFVRHDKEKAQFLLFSNRWHPTFSDLASWASSEFSFCWFWQCHENRVVKSSQTIPHNLVYVSFKSAYLHCGLG